MQIDCILCAEFCKNNTGYLKNGIQIAKTCITVTYLIENIKRRKQQQAQTD
ncbi:MAG: hypothetical protein EPGJADBJ_00763 [Saprospiraceae bacterium]|nr:hypothetical protein [Saprospiraceae bacterium]